MLIDAVLPASLNEGRNIRLTEGYTSAAGKTYFQGISLSDRLVVKYDLGQGYSFLYLNGIKLYGFDGKDTKLLASRGYYCQCWNESFARNECKDMLKDFLLNQSMTLRETVPQDQIDDFADAMIDLAMVNQRPDPR